MDNKEIEAKWVAILDQVEDMPVEDGCFLLLEIAILTMKKNGMNPEGVAKYIFKVIAIVYGMNLTIEEEEGFEN